MHPITEIDDELVASLRTSRHFILNLPKRVSDRIPLIQTLLEWAGEAFVWPQPKCEKPRPMPTEFLASERGRYRMIVSKVSFAGHGPFWHLGDRGSIVFHLPCMPEAFDLILKQCPLSPGSTSVGWCSRSTLAKANSAGAIRYCDQVVQKGEIAILLRQGGTDFLSLFAPEKELLRLYCLAKKHCPRWNIRE